MTTEADKALAVPEDVRDSLTKRELDAYRVLMATPLGKEFVGPGVAEEAWRLFMAGQNCDSIAETTKLKLGVVVRLRVEKDWDVRKAEYREQQLRAARGNYQQAHLENLGHAQLNSAAARVLAEIRLLKFIATRDLDQLTVDDIKRLEDPAQVKQWMDLMGKLSGQVPPDGTTTTRVEGEVLHRHITEGAAESLPPEPPLTIQALLKAKKEGK